MPEAELNELIGLLQARGLSHETSVAAARELSEDNALRAHLSVELGINEEEFANPWAAALSSALSFTLGSLLPLVAILLPPSSMRIPVVFVAVLFALALTGAVSASLGQAPKLPAVARLVLGGAAAMAVTFAIGQLLDATAV